MEYTFFQCIYFFFIYSFIGWIFEESIASFQYGKFVNRGFVNGPLCIKYGFCMLIILTDVSDLMTNPLLQFIVCFVVITIIQYLSGVVIKKITGKRFWNYSSHRWNLDGYVSVQTSLYWAVLAILCVWLVHPFIYIIYELVPFSAMKIIEWFLLIVFIMDCFITITSSLKLKLEGNLYEGVATQLVKTKQGIGNRLFLLIQRRMYTAFPEMREQDTNGATGFGMPKDRVFAKGLCFDKLVWIFFISALVGDWIETVYVFLTSGVLMSRSSLIYGTFSVVWGLGGAIITGVLYSLRDKNDRYCFIAGFLIGGVYEYSCSVFTELVFGTTFWDYSHLPFNINGRVNLLFCFFWGILAIVWIKLLYPLAGRLIEKIPPVAGKILTAIIIAVMSLDILISSAAVYRYVQRNTGNPPTSAIESFIDMTYPNSLIEWVYPDMKIVQ
jgi:uncharacterized membrane protein